MDLLDYPRPANDTGIGIHWVPGYAASVGLGRIREFWLPELKAMGVKWIKIFNHDGALDFCELLLSEGLARPLPKPRKVTPIATAARALAASKGNRPPTSPSGFR